MKKIILLIVLLFAFDFGYGQTTLAAGDIAITGFNSDDPDQFTFVLLTDISNTTTIKFTDNGWLAAGGFRAGEAFLTWTATSDLSCGTEITVTDNSPFSVTVGTITDAGNFRLAVSGDQILAYQGAEVTPTFVYAVHFDGNSGWSADATSANTSALPLGLTDGVNAIAIDETDNANYDCSTNADISLILAAASNSSNWIRSDSILSLGGCTYTCNSCLTTATWESGAWVGGFTPSSTTFVVMKDDYTATTANSFSACSLWIDAGNDVTVSDGGFIEVINDVVVNGNLVVETQGNFVQRGNTGTFDSSGGTSRVNKITAPKSAWYYYTYWSSPVTSVNMGTVFPDVNGDRRFWYDASNFINVGNGIDDNGDDWQYALGGDPLLPGVGYAVTEARLFPGTPVSPATGTASFIGSFNTSNIDVDIFSNAPNVAAGRETFNLIGNPYPSAIDFDAFQLANASVIDGVVYLWSQATAPNGGNPGNEQINFSQNDYAVYNVGAGGVTPSASGAIPNQYIPSGQGFFVAGLDTNTATFTNAIRTADATSNSLFFKGNSKKSKTTNLDNRLWINLTSNNGVFSQILIAYVDNATDGKDGLSYDTPRIINQNYAAVLYSSIDSSDEKYIIQGKNSSSINEDEIINIGFGSTIEVETEYKFSIAQIEGNFLTNNTVYLKDNLLNTLHNLSDSDYAFTSEVGEFNARFEIVFNANALSIEDAIAKPNTLKIIELEGNRVQFTTSNTIKSVKIFDLLGRQLYDFKGKNQSETYELSNLSSTVYIAKVELSNGAVITKKAFKK